MPEYFSIISTGARLQELKHQLQQQMKTARDINRKEAILRHRLDNEEFEDEEEEYWTDENCTDEHDSNSGGECKESV